MINFKANLVYNDRNILKYNSLKKAEKHPVSFIKLNPTDEKDVFTLLKTKDLWTKSRYANTIYTRALEMFYDNDNSNENEFFLLTEQTKDFESLDAEKVLAMCLVKNCSKYSKYIAYLQTNPLYMYNNDKNFSRNFKGIGSEVLNCLKELFKDFYLVLNASNKENINFYLKNGFKLINKDTKYLTFKRNNLKP